MKLQQNTISIWEHQTQISNRFKTTNYQHKVEEDAE